MEWDGRMSSIPVTTILCSRTCSINSQVFKNRLVCGCLVGVEMEVEWGRGGSVEMWVCGEVGVWRCGEGGRMSSIPVTARLCSRTCSINSQVFKNRLFCGCLVRVEVWVWGGGVGMRCGCGCEVGV